MSILSGPEIRRRVEADDGIRITPFNPKNCGANSYDVHLGHRLLSYVTNPGQPIDPDRPPPVAEVPLGEGGRWLLTPGRVYLGCTMEYTETRGLVPVLYGRSSVGRLGLFIHCTAGFGDDGFCGNWTLELVATQPVMVRPGMRIGQLIYHTLEGQQRPYQGRYQGDTGPVASRFHLPEGGAK